jgi:hypothetical protein
VVAALLNRETGTMFGTGSLAAAGMCVLGPLCVVLGLRLMFAAPAALEPEQRETEEVTSPGTTPTAESRA